MDRTRETSEGAELMWVPQAECQSALGSWIHWGSVSSEDSERLEEEKGTVPCVGMSLLGDRTVSLQQNQSRRETRAGGISAHCCSI